jgi:hypothetical protein
MIKIREIRSLFNSKLSFYDWVKIQLKKIDDLENEYTKENMPLGIKHHLIYEDITGESIGCGCNVCLMRYALTKERKRKLILHNRISEYEEAEKVYNKIKDWKFFDLNKVNLFQAKPRLLILSSIGINNKHKIVRNLEEKYKQTSETAAQYSKMYHTLLKQCEV